MTKILGIDPALNKTGWAIIEANNGSLIYLNSGVIICDGKLPLAEKLAKIAPEIKKIISTYQPEQVAIEETFVNKNPSTSLKLGHARGAIIVSCQDSNLPIFEYSPNLIKKSICGVGRAEKHQVAAMVKILMPKAQFKYDDESDALAVAITHVHHKG